MLVDLASSIKLVGANAVNHALHITNPRDADNLPPHFDLIVLRLPDAQNIHIRMPEEQLAMEPQRPEDDLVVLQPLKLQTTVCEDHVVPVNRHIELLAEQLRDVLPEDPQRIPHVGIVLAVVVLPTPARRAPAAFARVGAWLPLPASKSALNAPLIPLIPLIPFIPFIPLTLRHCRRVPGPRRPGGCVHQFRRARELPHQWPTYAPIPTHAYGRGECMDEFTANRTHSQGF
mmetsp:Transcript_8693/g.23624  ORF Transcript_8693/g.23624 Transcript_8693/m.23624 type:complete len:231 (-) Transcript_8693:151-843(-)